MAELSHVTRSKEQAKVAYDQLSRWYDWLAASSEQPLASLGLKRLNASLGESVLEIGSGTGHALLALATAVGDSGKVCGVDISRGMCTVARERIAQASPPQQILIEQADAAALPIRANAFDAVFLSFALELFDTPEIPIVLSECRRVLKPIGRICVVAMTRDEHEYLPQRIYEWFHQLMPAYVDCRPIFVQSALAQAGFQIKDITRRMMWGLPVDICLAQKSGE
jgi:ubiquinone/menaquinone biosynthesis C-methylase UbiE